VKSGLSVPFVSGVGRTDGVVLVGEVSGVWLPMLDSGTRNVRGRSVAC